MREWFFSATLILQLIMSLFIRKIVLFILVFLNLPLIIKAQQVNNSERDYIDTANSKDLIDCVNSFFHISPQKIIRRKGKKIYFSLLPTSASVPGGGKALITSTRAGFYLGNRRNTFLSSVSFSPYLNFKGRYAVSFKSDIYTNQNKWNIQGDTRFSLYPEYVYNYNNVTNETGKLPVTYKYIRFYQTVLKRIRPYFLIGLGYNLDYHIGIQSLVDTIPFSKFTGYEHGTMPNTNSFSSGITFNLLYDLRNNSINPVPGYYFNFIYRVNPSYLGNGNNSWESVYLDARKYFALKGNKKHLFASWFYIWSALNNSLPYLDLPGIGYEPNQRSGRGIEQNRYRGKTLVYLESEYRSDITNNGLLGYVMFANVNTVSGLQNGNFSSLHPAIGAGLRLKFNKQSDTNIAVDFGISKSHSGFTFSLGEAF